jgi:LPXTG-site transpeptidase (sortase) family protein
MRFTLYLSTIVALITVVVSIYHIDHVSAATSNVTQAPQKSLAGDLGSCSSLPCQGTFAGLDQVATTTGQQSSDPTELSIPSIKLDVPVVPVGLNTIGQMDVPSGRSGAVGWYEYGTVPGQEGSAVIDAHVFAAFSTLHNAKVGDDIYVTEDGTQLHFKITSSIVYKLADVPADLLFNKADGTYLNLITCAGTYDASLNTYDHRLVDYAVLIN